VAARSRQVAPWLWPGRTVTKTCARAHQSWHPHARILASAASRQQAQGAGAILIVSKDKDDARGSRFLTGW